MVATEDERTTKAGAPPAEAGAARRPGRPRRPCRNSPEPECRFAEVTSCAYTDYASER